MWGGEVAFQGKAATRDAVALIYRMLNEGYRWGGYYAAWHFWLGSDGGPAQWEANHPRAVFVRQWDWTFGSGQTVKRTFGIFNDTQYPDPITFTRRLTIDGKEIYAKTTTHHVAPGTAQKFHESIPLPTVAERKEGELSLALSARGEDVPAADGCTAFIEDSSHPAFQGLKNRDLFTWGPDHSVFRNAYLKPTRGAKSLVQCGPRLEYSALVEVPVGKGVMYPGQLELGTKLGVNAVAQRLLLNLIRAGFDYRLEFAEVAAAITDPQLGKAVDAIGLQYSEATGPLAAVRDAKKKIAVVSATPAHLKQLADDPAALEAFWRRGGTPMLCGLTPEGLADFNRIVGVDHVIRPFKRERVRAREKISWAILLNPRKRSALGFNISPC